MNKQHGYTMVELLVTIAISGVLFTVIGSVLFQLSAVSSYGNHKLTACHELQNAASWYYLDGQMAISATGGTSLTWSLPGSQTITYSLSGNNLKRSTGVSTLTLAQDISAVSFSVQGRLVSMNITSSISGSMDANEQNIYQVYLRMSP
jgi:prepilin-type N-terminal cleavage/methylation domain-containing protein